MKLSNKVRAYIREYQERIERIPEGATEVADHRSYGVGQVYHTIGNNIYIADHTGSDVPEWAIRFYEMSDCDDELFENDGSFLNRDIIAMLNAPQPKRTRPEMKLCDCGHYTQSPMSASLGSSCPDCYDRMSD